MGTFADFLSGMATMGFLVAGLFFFRFWRRTGDKIFFTFGIAFCLLALNQSVVTLFAIPREAVSWAYALRIMAFGLLIIGIATKNIGTDKSDRR